MGKRKKKLSLIGIILLVAAVAGAIVAVTGIFLLVQGHVKQRLYGP